MDPASVTAGVIAAQLFANTLNGAAESAGSSVVEWVRSKFSERQEVARLEDAPDSPSRISALAVAIDDEAAADPQVATELKQLLERVQQDQPDVIQKAVGSQNINANHSTVHVTFGTAAPGPQERLVIEWSSGDVFVLVNKGTAIAKNVDYTWDDSMLIHQIDATPTDLEPDESLQFMATRHMGTQDERITINWSNEASEHKSRKIRVPHRQDR